MEITITKQLVADIETIATYGLMFANQQIPFDVHHNNIIYSIVEFLDSAFLDCNEIAGFHYKDRFLAILAPNSTIPKAYNGLNYWSASSEVLR